VQARGTVRLLSLTVIQSTKRRDQHRRRKAHKLACPATTQRAREADELVAAAAGTSLAAVTDEPAQSCCDHCGAQSAEPLVCSGCDAGVYCTPECQLGAWYCFLFLLVFHQSLFCFRPGHKKACRAVQKQRKAAQEEAREQVGPACDECGVQSAEVFACPACEMAHYCSQQHQHDAWCVLFVW
jgi:hypothetical protein